MTTGQVGTEKREVPIIRYLHLPEKEGEAAYLEGTKCRNCGEHYVDRRRVCVKCYGRDLEAVRLSGKGEVFTFTVIHQSAPGIPVPYIGAVIRLDEGPFVTGNIVGIEPNPALLKAGMKVEMITEKVRADAAGNDVVAYRFRLA